jgi:succinate-semialdehyde dehydrogenase/glutarate-semialdehyde dehydrogenase
MSVDLTFEKRMYIGGQLIGAPNADVICPATEQGVAKVAFGDAGHAKDALAAAEAAFGSWSRAPIAERATWMHRLRDAVVDHQDHLRECVHLEVGKSWAATEEDYTSLVNSLSFYAEEIARFRSENLVSQQGTHTHTLTWEPVGVAAAFLAWNFPLLNLAFKIGPAMAAGCPIVLKPSFKSPLSAYAVGEICASIGLPPGVVNIVCGPDEEVGDALSSSTIPALLTLIGSARTGRRVMEKGASSIKRYSMELGGNAPVLVFDDADVALAADIICALKFGNSGQICVTPNRVFVADANADALRDAIVERAAAVRIGHDRHEDIDMGPLIDAAAWSRVDALVADAVDNGATLLHGGGQPKALTSGHYYSPTVLDGVTPDMRIAKEEVFGPVVSLMRYKDETDGLRLANDTQAGLTAYVFTKDLGRAERCARDLRFGEVQINGVSYGIDLPHVGIKQSGIGCDCSHLALHDYLAPKRISSALAA